MKIMSFNILCKGTGEYWFENRIGLVLSMIEKNNPDILAVQEATPAWMDILNEKLEDYDFAGVGRDDGKKAGEYSAIFFKKGKYALETQSTFWLSETPDIPSTGWDARCTRICTIAKLKTLKNERSFVIANTHLDHIGENARANGMRLICSRLEPYFDLPVVVTGDFNSWPESTPYEIMLENGFCDSRATAQLTDEVFTFHAFELPEGNTNSKDFHKIIDYIFVKNAKTVLNFKTLTEKIDGKFPSDHYPVIAEIKI